ncbi:DsbA family protein [bacterium endosymbiont of Escarpia laminata]|nr:MAG: DsbA family protein [bacterium endosymbiont of Escarpia laminata]
MGIETDSTLFYIHDPMCSWCWAFRPVLAQLREHLPPGVKLQKQLGGLAPDSDDPMPEEMQQTLQATWNRIQEKLPETRFNFGFWQQCKPRRSTYPACRAVIAAGIQGEAFVEPMILAIQEAYYLHAQNPSDSKTLFQLAGNIGLDEQQFSEALEAPATHRLLEEEIESSRTMGVRSFPALILQQGTGFWPIPVDYQNVGPILETLDMVLD